MNKITWNELDGNWKIEGVELQILPHKVYGALYKLIYYGITQLSPK